MELLLLKCLIDRTKKYPIEKKFNYSWQLQK